MSKRILHHLRGNVVAYLALFLVITLAPTSAYATHLVVRSSDIVNGQVKNPDLAFGAVSTRKIRDGQVSTRDLAAASVNSAKVADNTIGLNDLSPAARPKLPAARLAEIGTPPAMVDNTFTTLLELQLPRGSWALYAKGYMYVPSPSRVTCDLRNGDRVLDRTSGHASSGVLDLPFALIRPVSLPAPATVSLQCYRTNGGQAVDLKIMATQLQ